MNITKLVMENPVCIICYSNEEYCLKCENKSCKTNICEGCFKDYLKHCISEKRLVRCINEHCRSYITSRHFSKNADYYTDYKNTLLTSFINSQSPDVETMVNIINIKDKLRASREQFYKTFSVAVAMTINISLRKKAANIIKNNKLYIKEDSKRAKRICMNYQCDGKMLVKTKIYECIKCDGTFCITCEKPHVKEHKCNQEDIESLEIISKYTRCPACKIFIERSFGCDVMTCTNCRTNFSYRTGEVLSFGNNHNVNLEKVHTGFFFKIDYGKRIFDILNKVELLKPPSPDINSLNKEISKILTIKDRSDKDFDDIGNNIVKKFEKYLRSKNRYYNYITASNKIVELHDTKELTIANIELVLKKYHFKVIIVDNNSSSIGTIVPNYPEDPEDLKNLEEVEELEGLEDLAIAQE